MSLDGGYRSAACDVVISGVAGNETETTEASIPFLGQWRDTASHMPMTATCGEEDDNLALFVDARGSGAVPDERKVTGLGASVSDGARK